MRRRGKKKNARVCFGKLTVSLFFLACLIATSPRKKEKKSTLGEIRQCSSTLFRTTK